MITSTALVLLMIPGVGYVHIRKRGSVTQRLTVLPQFLLFRPGSEKVCVVLDLALSHGRGRHLLPMVLLGLLARFLPHCGQVPW
jgi:hypothetical protein